ncbi:MAG: hypothetical protein M1829_004634 [Trizodia sp. TS-e1964]|nr:MAG: hypothetical protein M1829_004634 [Trizodia sp. TS-e1964]
MVLIDVVHRSNLELKRLVNRGQVALFVGGTSGIGASTMKRFFEYTVMPHVYFVGRNEQAASEIIKECKALNPEGTISFIKSDITLLKNVDSICAEIKGKEKRLNLLFMTSAALSLQGRTETEEGLDKKFVANYYHRLRFTTNLLPLLTAAGEAYNPTSPPTSPKELSRVISVLAPGEEGKIFEDDLDLRHNFGIGACATHSVVMTDFAFEHLAATHPHTSFVHSSPGIVKTGYLKDSGAAVQLGGRLLYALLSMFATSLEESGQRHLYSATSWRYPPRASVEAGCEVAVGSAGVRGSGAYFVGADNELRVRQKVLSEMRERGVPGKIWAHTMDVFAKIDRGGRV